MGRIKVVEHFDHRVFETLMQYGVDQDLAKSIAILYRRDGASTALYQLYVGGWRVCGFKVESGGALGLRKTKNGRYRFSEIGDGNEFC